LNVLDVVIIEASVILSVSAIIIILIVRKRPAEKKASSTFSHTLEATANVESLIETIWELQLEKEDLQRALWKYKRKPTKKAELILLLFGVISLISSIVFTSSILAFLGLGFIFWGTLFLFIRPVTYVKSSLLDSTILPSLITIDRMLMELNYRGNAVYMPPRQLKGLKEGVLFIPAEKELILSAIEDMPQEKTFINPYGLRLIPLGQGLVDLFERELETDLARTDLDYLQNNLPKLLIEDLEILRDFEMNISDDLVKVRMVGSVYSNICSEARKLTNICSRIGCPLCSAIAYALAKATGKAVTIEKNEFQENDTIETWYRLLRLS